MPPARRTATSPARDSRRSPTTASGCWWKKCCERTRSTRSAPPASWPTRARSWRSWGRATPTMTRCAPRWSASPPGRWSPPGAGSMAADKRTPEELELQAPDRLDAAGLVQLDPDHPGFRDPVYRARRDAIARIAFEYRDGDPVPRVDYTEEEEEVWRTVWRNLAPLHELVGHAATFCDPAFARLNRAFGQAAVLATAEQLGRIARVYWYTLEFGLCEEEGAVKAYGAGLLSSFGELGRFEQHAQLRPLDLELVAATPYDPTDYQKVLYVSPDLGRTAELVSAWLERAAKVS